MKTTTLASLFLAATAAVASAAAPPGLCGMVNSDGSVWDFSSLTLTNGSYEASDGHYDYEFNLCAPLTTNPHGSVCSGAVSVCQTLGDRAVAAESRWGGGAAPPVWQVLPSGNVGMTTVNGDVCFASQKPRETVFEFVCKEGAAKPTATVVSEACSTTITVTTEAACRPIPAPGCFVPADFERVYDLSPLAGQVFEVEQDNYKYRVGLCGTTVPCGDNAAAGNAWACQDAAVSGQAVAALGRWNSTAKWSLEEGVPSLVSRNGDVCFPSSLPRVAGIQFTCQMGATGPLTVRNKGCSYLFTLPTPLACLA